MSNNLCMFGYFLLVLMRDMIFISDLFFHMTHLICIVIGTDFIYFSLYLLSPIPSIPNNNNIINLKFNEYIHSNIKKKSHSRTNHPT